MEYQIKNVSLLVLSEKTSMSFSLDKKFYF